MKNPFCFCIILLQLLLFSFADLLPADSTTVSYKVSMPFPSNHLFEIDINIENFPDRHIEFMLPAWRSGRYTILNFAAGVQSFTAEDENGNKLVWSKTNKSTWLVENNEKRNFKIKYKVYSNEFTLRTRGLNDQRGFLDASAVLMYTENLRYVPLQIEIIPYNNWHVTTGLDNLYGRENFFTAPDYDYLADCPILIGEQKDYEFSVQGVKHTVSFSGDGNYNADTVTRDLARIAEEVQSFWGDIPFEHYTFLILMNMQDFGATEHLNSTVMNVSPLLFINKDSYNSFLSTSIHEYFHTWNVKQLRPKGLDPYDFTGENYTSELWIAEGITTYYQNIFLLRTGFITLEKYFETIEKNIKDDKERPGNYVQSLAEAGFDSWIKHSSNTQNKFIAETDFYAKGANVGLLIDLEIRHNSSNKYSLNDVMTTMYKSFPLGKGGYTNNDFIKVCEDYSGHSMKDFFDSYLYGVDSLDWEKYLGYAGLNLKINPEKEKPTLGILTRESGDRFFISGVIPGSPGYDGGLDINDEIIALNGYRVRSSNLNNRIADMKAGEVVRITVMREDKLKEVDIILRLFSPVKYTIEKVKRPDKLQKMIFEDWLGTKW